MHKCSEGGFWMLRKNTHYQIKSNTGLKVESALKYLYIVFVIYVWYTSIVLSEKYYIFFF
jgi:hypothetical protein